MVADTRLGGKPRTRLVAEVRARHQPCPMCGYPIDQTLPRTGRRSPLASVIDEWVPREPCGNKHKPCRHGCTPTAPGDVSLTNCVELHSHCNGSKSNHWPITAEMRERCRTHIASLLGATQPHIRPI